jgi:glutamate transport system permease protein
MSSVLYDVAGPKARRRYAAGTVVAGVVFLAVVVVVVRRLNTQGQFAMAKWGPLIDPGNENFAGVWRSLGAGLRATLIAAVLAIVLALVLGTVLGVARIMSSGPARVPLRAVMEVLRGLPVVVTIYLVYVLLPAAGVNVGPLPGPDGLWYLVIALTLYNSVIFAEILRAGVASLPRGQREAGLAHGLTELQTMRMVLLPQAFRAMLPALISQLVVVLKDTSLAALVGLYVELLRQALYVREVLSNPIQVLTVVAVIFIAVNMTLSRIAVLTERRLGRRGAGPVGAAELAIEGEATGDIVIPV